MTKKKKKIKPLIWLPKKVINGRLINLFEGWIEKNNYYY